MNKSKGKVSNTCNYFYEILSKQRIDIDGDLNQKEIDRKITLIVEKLRELQQDQLREWKQVYVNKIRQQYSKLINLSSHEDKKQSKFLRGCLKMFIMVCASIGIQYNQAQFQQMVKSIYLKEYDKLIKPAFIKAGFSLREEVLEYKPKRKVYICCFDDFQ